MDSNKIRGGIRRNVCNQLKTTKKQDKIPNPKDKTITAINEKTFSSKIETQTIESKKCRIVVIFWRLSIWMSHIQQKISPKFSRIWEWSNKRRVFRRRT